VLNGTDETVWAYHYGVGENGAWTAYKFPGPVSAAGSSRGMTLVAIGNGVYKADEINKDDYGHKIDCRLVLRTITRRNQTLLKQVFVKFYANATSEVHLKIEEMDLLLKRGSRGDIAFLDHDIAYLDHEPLVPSLPSGDIAFLDHDIAYLDHDPLVPSPQSSDIRKRCNIRRWRITPEITVENGEFHMTLLQLEIAEV
jgi:hypothetical protein